MQQHPQQTSLPALNVDLWAIRDEDGEQELQDQSIIPTSPILRVTRAERGPLGLMPCIENTPVITMESDTG